MTSPFPPLSSCYLLLLPENYDPNGKHMEYRDTKGVLFARMTKVYKRSAFQALFDVFRPAQDIYAELRDADNNLLLTTISCRGETKHDCRVDLHQPDGKLLGVLRDASYGVDFFLPDDTLLGTARRPDDSLNEPMEVVHTYRDPTGCVVGTCERSFPDQQHGLWDFLEGGGVSSSGRSVQKATIDEAVAAKIDPTLRTFLLLFPALQHLRYARSG